MARSAQEFLRLLLNSITRYYTATYSSDTNLYQILKTYGAQFASGSLEMDITRNNAFIIACDSSKLFDNFGTFFNQPKYYLQSSTDDRYFSGSAVYTLTIPTVSGSMSFKYNVQEQIAVPSYRKQLSFMIEAAVAGGTPAGITRMANAYTLINPDIREFVSLPAWKLKSTDDDSNYAVKFDAVSAAPIKVSLNDSLQLLEGVTIEAWLKTSHSGAGANIIIRKPSDIQYSNWILFLGESTPGAGDAVPVLQVYTDGSPSGTVVGTNIKDNKWHHIVGTADGTRCRMYVDGIFIAQTISSALPGPSHQDIYIGANGPTAKPPYEQRYVGTVDALRIFDGAISTESVKAHYNNGIGLYTPHSGSYLRGQWHFDEGSGTSAVDSSGYHNDGYFTIPNNPARVTGKVFKRGYPESITRLSSNIWQLNNFSRQIINEWEGAYGLAISGSLPADKVTAGYLVLANSNNTVTIAPIYEQYLRV